MAGERRCEAARKAKLDKVPAIFIDSQNYEEISLVENMLRSDLTPVEEAEALNRLMQSRHYSQKSLAKILGKSRVNVTETLSLNKLPQEMKDECRKDPSVPKRVLIDIARKKNERSMLKAFQRYKDKLKPKKKTPKKEATPAEKAVNALLTTENILMTLDMGEMSQDEKDTIFNVSDALKVTLDEFISNVHSDE